MMTILTVFRKEFTDTIRDRRTLLMMIVVPLFFYPVLAFLLGYFSQQQRERIAATDVRLAIIDPSDACRSSGLLSHFEEKAAKEHLVIDVNAVSSDAAEIVERDDYEVAIQVPKTFMTTLNNGGSAQLQIFYKGTSAGASAGVKVKELIADFAAGVREQRLRDRSIDESLLEPVVISVNNVASAREEHADGVFGGMFTYFLIFLTFVGSMPAAVDLGAGEKERGTLETLLTSPASLWSILAGKLLVVVLTGLVSAMVSLCSVIPIILFGADLGEALGSIVGGAFTFTSVLIILSLLLPLAVFFASITLTLSFYARSAKEAHSLVTPVMMVVVGGLMVGMLPGMKLTIGSAFIPVLNASLAMRAVLGGTTTLVPMLIVYISLLLLAAGALFLGAKIVARERTLFRG
ncbi:MAG: sodium transport system permease protein [Verrucomicrobiales bacterium]